MYILLIRFSIEANTVQPLPHREAGANLDMDIAESVPSPRGGFGALIRPKQSTKPRPPKSKYETL